jgi:7-cyano-7-deazaguanine synthase
MTRNAVVIASGGLDSTVLAYSMSRWVEDPWGLHMLSFDYGQRHRRELEFAERTSERLGARWDLIDLRSVTPFLKGSSLTDEVAVPHGHYAEENMKATIVPNRNAMMLSVAVAVAVGDGARIVGFAAHAGDHPVYPDCRPEFVRAFALMESLAIGDSEFEIVSPYINMTKADIVHDGHSMGVPFQLTWSCYEGGEVHCGRCGTCVERKEAFRLAKVIDPTVYADASFMVEAYVG